VSALVLSCKLWIEVGAAGRQFGAVGVRALKLEILSRVYPELRSYWKRVQEACILARESGVVEISRSEDVGVRVIEDSGRGPSTDWPRSKCSAVRYVGGYSGMPLTDGPANPHEILIFSLISILHECMPVRWKHCSVCKRFGE